MGIVADLGHGLRPARLMVDLTRVASRCAMAELELQAKGYSEAQSRTATKYAMNWARTIAGQTPEEHRSEVFASLVEERLRGAQDYLDGMARAAEKREYGREMKRAARDGQFQRGISDYGPGTATDQAWRDSLADAETNWERKFRRP